MAGVQPLVASPPPMASSQPSFPRASRPADSRFTGRRWIPNGRNQPARPNTTGWSSDRSSDRGAPAAAAAVADPWLLSKLAAMPTTTRSRARKALAAAHAARTPAPRRREIVTPRTSFTTLGLVPRGKPNDMLLPPGLPIMSDRASRPSSRQQPELEPIRLPGAGVSKDSADSALKAVGNKEGTQMSKVPHAGKNKQPLLVGRRSRTAELLGLNSMGAPLISHPHAESVGHQLHSLLCP